LHFLQSAQALVFPALKENAMGKGNGNDENKPYNLIYYRR
jgi:hypothetical protein